MVGVWKEIRKNAVQLKQNALLEVDDGCKISLGGFVVCGGLLTYGDNICAAMY